MHFFAIAIVRVGAALVPRLWRRVAGILVLSGDGLAVWWWFVSLLQNAKKRLRTNVEDAPLLNLRPPSVDGCGTLPGLTKLPLPDLASKSSPKLVELLERCGRRSPTLVSAPVLYFAEDGLDGLDSSDGFAAASSGGEAESEASLRKVRKVRDRDVSTRQRGLKAQKRKMSTSDVSAASVVPSSVDGEALEGSAWESAGHAGASPTSAAPFVSELPSDAGVGSWFSTLQSAKSFGSADGAGLPAPVALVPTSLMQARLQLEASARAAAAGAGVVSGPPAPTPPRGASAGAAVSAPSTAAAAAASPSASCPATTEVAPMPVDAPLLPLRPPSWDVGTSQSFSFGAQTRFAPLPLPPPFTSRGRSTVLHGGGSSGSGSARPSSCPPSFISRGAPTVHAALAPVPGVAVGSATGDNAVLPVPR